MRNINLFVEDRGHELFLRALIDRFVNKYAIEVEPLQFSNARGGHGKVMRELKDYMKELRYKFQAWQQTTSTQTSPDTSNPPT